jgi:hypothetical protein
MLAAVVLSITKILREVLCNDFDAGRDPYLAAVTKCKRSTKHIASRYGCKLPLGFNNSSASFYDFLSSSWVLQLSC